MKRSNSKVELRTNTALKYRWCYNFFKKMNEYLGECRYGQYGCDYVIIQCESYNIELNDKIQKAADDMSTGDREALEDAQPILDELEEKKLISIVKLMLRKD